MSEMRIQDQVPSPGPVSNEKPSRSFGGMPLDPDYGKPVEWRPGERVRFYRKASSPIWADVRAFFFVVLFAALATWLFTTGDRGWAMIVALFALVAIPFGIARRRFLMKTGETLIDWDTRQVRLTLGQKIETIPFEAIDALRLDRNFHKGRRSKSWTQALVVCNGDCTHSILKASANGRPGRSAELFDRKCRELAEALGVPMERKGQWPS